MRREPGQKMGIKWENLKEEALKLPFVQSVLSSPSPPPRTASESAVYPSKHPSIVPELVQATPRKAEPETRRCGDRPFSLHILTSGTSRLRNFAKLFVYANSVIKPTPPNPSCPLSSLHLPLRLLTGAGRRVGVAHHLLPRPRP